MAGACESLKLTKTSMAFMVCAALCVGAHPRAWFYLLSVYLFCIVFVMRWLSSKEPDRRQAAVVLGAGVVGIAAAYELQKEGYTVTVIDRQPEAASECSFSNGGHRNFHFNPSIAVPGTPREFLRSWVSPESTIFLPYSTRWCTLLWDPDFWQWALRLVPNFSARKVQRNSEAGTQLIRYSQQRTAIIQEQHLTVGKVWEWEGSTAVCTEPVPPDKIYKENEVLLSKEETLQREPCLAYLDAIKPIYGSIVSNRCFTQDCRKFTSSLESVCKALGLVTMYNTKVTGLSFADTGHEHLHQHEQHKADRKQVATVHTDCGDVQADVVVVALGAYTPKFLQPYTKICVPIYPVRGYAVEMPITPQASANNEVLRTGTLHYSRGFGVHRFDDVLRVSGLAELRGWDTSVNRDLVIDLFRKRLKTFCGLDLDHVSGGVQNVKTWCGLRPVTPDNLPMIGQIPGYSNLFICSGHSFHGWALACGSARILADIIARRNPEIDATPFDPRRFRHWW